MSASKNKLTLKQAKFVEEYLIDFNATQAAIRAGYSAKTAGWIGQQLLSKTHISEAIKLRRDAISHKTGVTQERIVLEMKRLALFDIRMLFKDDGSPIPIQDLSDDAAAAIVGLDVVSIGNSDNGIGQVMKYKMPDKNKALENLAKILGHMERISELEKLQTEKIRRELEVSGGNEQEEHYRANRRITIAPYDARLQSSSHNTAE